MLTMPVPQIKFFWMLLNMSEYIEYLKQDDAMMSSSLQDVVMPTSQHVAADTPVDHSGVITIQCENGSTINVVPKTFSLNYNQCEIIIDTGVNTLKKIQAMLGHECLVTFYDMTRQLELMEYQVDNANSVLMITTLKFFVVNDPN